MANGGTGRSSVTSGNLLVGAGTGAMTLLAGSAPGDAVTWNGTAWVSGVVGGAAPQVNVYVSPSPAWTKPATLKGIKVTVIGGGGSGGTVPAVPAPAAGIGFAGGGGGGGCAILWLSAPAIPGPQVITAGAGTNSFGTLASATGGGTGSNIVGLGTANGGTNGTGTGGTINISGSTGYVGGDMTGGGAGGASIFNPGASSGIGRSNTNGNGVAAVGYGAGGSGAIRGSPQTTGYTGGAGSPGIIIVEEFY